MKTIPNGYVLHKETDRFGTLGFSEIPPPLALTRLSVLRILKEFLDIPNAFL